MLHAFIDESERGTSHFFLSALLVKDENLSALNQSLDDLIQEFSSTTPVQKQAELHGYDMMQQKSDWRGIPLRLASSVYQRAMKIIESHAEALYIECIDRDAQARKYRILYNHRRLAIGYILERVNEYATRTDDSAIAYLDDHYTAAAGRKEFVHYKDSGTFGYKSSKLDRIQELDFHDSRLFRGLQAADLCTYIANRIVTCKDAEPKALHTQTQLWESISGIRGRGRCRIWP